MNIQRFIVNPFQEVCYVVHGLKGWPMEHCLLIDCGAYYPEEEAAIERYITGQGLQPIAHLLTHGHLDHCFGARWVWETWGLRPIMHEADSSLLHDMEQQAAMFGIPLQKAPMREHLPLSSLPAGIRHIHTPGHTQGSVCYLFAEESALFSGDTLFAGGVGRTDLPGGNWGQLQNSLGTLMQLAPGTLVFPGHGGQTSIEREQDENPYI